MRIPVLLVAFVSVLVASAAHAQQPVPDAPQPQQQPQKKQPAKAPDPPPAKDDNAFPEDQSKAAADKADDKSPQDGKQDEKKPPAADDNAFPEAQSKAAADQAKQQDKPQDKQPPSDKDNPFPEDQSKAAAKAAGNDVSPVPAVPVHDPARSRKDDEVGRFYLDKGDYRGALLRYQDATATDPTNVNAIFGLAESQHNLKQNAEALKNYELYLRIVPDGPKAKQAMKALKEIEAGK